MILQSKFFAIAGGSGCGKTSLRHRLVASGQIDGSYFIYSDDDQLYKMPGYQEAARKDFYYARKDFMPAVWAIVDPALEEALAAGKNILYDRTCSRDVNFEIMQKAKRLGYHVEMHALTTNSLVAHYRIARREWLWRKGELTDIHGVLPDDLERTNAAFSKIFFDYATGTENAVPLDKVTLWREEVGEDIIVEYQDGRLVEVYNELEFEKFKNKGEYVNLNGEARRAAMSIYVR